MILAKKHPKIFMEQGIGPNCDQSCLYLLLLLIIYFVKLL